MVLRRVKASDADAAPHIVWNAFVDLLAMSGHADLAPAQRPAHLVFWYDAEVNNGGHLQYFLNRADRIFDTAAALRLLGAESQAVVFDQAFSQWQSQERLPPADVDEYVEAALDAEFAAADEAFGACEPDLITLLERHLVQHEQDFVVRE